MVKHRLCVDTLFQPASRSSHGPDLSWFAVRLTHKTTEKEKKKDRNLTFKPKLTAKYDLGDKDEESSKFE